MSTPPVIRRAVPADEALLVRMMECADNRRNTDGEDRPARHIFHELTDPNAYGFLYIIEARAETAGYLLVSWGYSAEHGGPYLLVDELYVEAAHRGCGLGRAALEFVAQLARERGASVIKLEVSDHNPEAAKLYLRAGFTDEKRRVLVRRLPTE